MFVRTGSSWLQEARLTASNRYENEGFGFCVAIWGDSALLGAGAEASAATGINGDQTDRRAYGAGAAYLFVRDQGVWTHEAYLEASDTDAGDNFGCSVGIWGDAAVAGAYHESSASTGVNGNQGNNSAPAAGAAYVFTRVGARVAYDFNLDSRPDYVLYDASTRRTALWYVSNAAPGGPVVLVRLSQPVGS